MNVKQWIEGGVALVAVIVTIWRIRKLKPFDKKY